MKAICYGHIHICQWLLNKLGHQYVTKNGKELMVCALNSGEVRSCQFLIKNGVKPHCEYFPLLNGCFFEEKYIPTYIWMILEGTFEDKQGNLLKKCTQEVIPKICQSLSQVHLSNFKRNLEKFGKIGNILRLTHSLNSGLFSSVPEGPLDMIREFSEIYKDDKLLRIKKFYLSLGQQSRTKYRNRHG
jgi:hypothetical protein